MVEDEERRQHAEAILADVDLGNWEVLIDDIAADLAEVHGDGMAEGLRLLDMDVPVDHVHARAVEWARQHAASLVTDIEENTRDMLRSTVEDALEERWGARELADAIAESTGFSDERANTISKTELSFAANRGNLEGYRSAAQQGLRVLKIWMDNDSEDECSDNADEGEIELDEDFPSGDPSPPAHPHCSCAIAAVVVDETEEGDDQE